MAQSTCCLLSWRWKTCWISYHWRRWWEDSRRAAAVADVLSWWSCGTPAQMPSLIQTANLSTILFVLHTQLTTSVWGSFWILTLHAWFVDYYFMSAAVTVDSSHTTASSSASWHRFSPPSNLVNGTCRQYASWSVAGHNHRKTYWWSNHTYGLG